MGVKNMKTQLIDWLPTKRTCNCKPNAINCLNRKEWFQNQMPIWTVSTKDADSGYDKKYRKEHPATYPTALAKRVIECYSHKGETVLDVFNGIGSTLGAANMCGRNGIGIEINPKYVEITKDRLEHKTLNTSNQIVIQDDSRNLLNYIPKESIDLQFTSPPYWDMLKQKPSARNARAKQYLKENYSDDPNDLSNAKTLEEFLASIKSIFSKVFIVLKKGKRCIINTGDYRRKGVFIPLHIHYIELMEDLGFILNNIILWDRQNEYQSGLFGYPSSFIVNNGMCEYLLEFQKPI
ncbi:MAG TPA: site-specific DNA-methyltransferase [Methanosarcinales archaeon]|nr:site-specific DNA-methyltransferase [Methanosarcinales archaeon]